MNCGHSRETLALFIENDLPGAQTEQIRTQVDACSECRQACEELRASQSLIRTRLKLPNSAPPEVYSRVRHEVLAKIQDEPRLFGWALQLERALVLSFRAHPYAIASLAILIAISASLWAQAGRAPAVTRAAAAVFNGKDTLVMPEGYRNWIFVGSSEGSRVYVSPAAYQKFARGGSLPEGTVIVMERPPEMGKDSAHHPTLVASVKDSSRFDGGWGFFDFSEKEGIARPRSAVSDGTCRPCHEAHAQTDHVFTHLS